jgi:hypothetical protein
MANLTSVQPVSLHFSHPSIDLYRVTDTCDDPVCPCTMAPEVETLPLLLTVPLQCPQQCLAHPGTLDIYAMNKCGTAGSIFLGVSPLPFFEFLDLV